ncbi:hypothetical protein ACFFGV_12285 [Pontibacillus salicampi]|uniref:Uncharacterized protein n=1 Tax=Pontibacillus salicampi TaxID=1449801 RepID=A0ABV6LPT3_9BACI
MKQMWALVIIMLSFLGYLEGKRIVASQGLREGIFFCAMYGLASVLSILLVVGVPIPTPLKAISIIYQPIINLIQG